MNCSITRARLTYDAGRVHLSTILPAFRLVYTRSSCSNLLLLPSSIPEDQMGTLSVSENEGVLTLTMGSMRPDTVGQDTTAQSTMGEGLIEAKLISREYCRSHWVITLSQSGKCINVDLSRNVTRYSRDPLPEFVSSIGFRIKEGKPPIDNLMEHLWLPVPFIKRPQDFCSCVQWV